jgi:uncharacterized RDD family membrane protein YckC
MFAGPAPGGRAAAEPAEAAVRWRIRAARIDNLIVYGAYALLCGLLHWRIAALSHLWVLGAASVAYHFVLEARDGQTIGKRRYGIRVVALDGTTPTVGAVAIRSVLRIVDQLPVWYLSGLLSMVRTGPAKRQRIGDVAAGTMVVATGRQAAAQGTPGWLLPAATLFAAAVSIFSVIAVVQAGSRPLDSTQQAQFVTGCQNSPGGQAIDCECLLNRLEAAGYGTPKALDDLVAQADAPSVPGSPNSARAVLEQAGAACRG